MPRRKKRPAKFNFKPFSPQQQRLIHWWRPMIRTSENNYVIADGSIRSGKTIACIIGFLTWSQEMFSGESFILAGKTMGALKKNVVRPMLQMLEAWGWPYEYIRSGTDARLEIGTNTYYLYGANTEAAQDALQGLTAAGAYLDEAALFPKSFVDQAIARCSVDGWKFWMNCNPAGPHHFIREEYLTEEAMKQKKVYHLHFTMDDNLSISPKRKEEYKKKINKTPKAPKGGLKTPGFVLDCVDAFLGDDPEYQAAFSGFLENREALKKPVLTTRSINTIINKLRKVSREEGIAMLDKAVERNWLTVYPLKADERPMAPMPNDARRGRCL